VTDKTSPDYAVSLPAAHDDVGPVGLQPGDSAEILSGMRQIVDLREKELASQNKSQDQYYELEKDRIQKQFLIETRELDLEHEEMKADISAGRYWRYMGTVFLLAFVAVVFFVILNGSPDQRDALNVVLTHLASAMGGVGLKALWDNRRHNS
jgi:hypothetical protein